MSNRLIDVNVKKLDQAGVYVKTFQEDVIKACNALHTAYDRLKEQNTEVDIAEIKEVVDKISAIISAEEENFNKLENTITAYSAKVKEMKKILERKSQ